MKYKGVIFDMDGTIVDTEPLWRGINKRLVESYGIDYSDELAKKVVEKSSGLAVGEGAVIIRDVCRIPDSASNFAKRKLEMCAEVYKEGISFIPGFENFWQKLCDLDIPGAIATNADDCVIEAAEKVLNIKRFFGDHIYGISCVGFLCKPNPAVYKHAASKLGIDPAYCLAFEDTPFGISAAKKAGMFCVGINSAGEIENLKEADIIVEDYNDSRLKQIIEP